MVTATLNLGNEVVQHSVRSKDGTNIRFSRFGSGPAVVFVHGSLSVGTDWQGVTQSLARDFTCILMDRRGHGRSDAGCGPYGIDREYEDVTAVLSVAGPNASLVGHSYGAICALGAAMRVPVRRLVLYEPPLPIGGLIAGEHLEPYRRAVKDGRLDDALEIGLTEFVRLPAKTVDAMRSSSGWSRLAAQVASWPRELEAMDELEQNVDPYVALTCPTLLLLGSKSPEHPFRHATAALLETLPDVTVESLPGQSHMAMRSAQNLLAQQISQFLSDETDTSTSH